MIPGASRFARRRRAAGAGAALLLALAVTGVLCPDRDGVRAQGPSAPAAREQYEVKAAYLYSFLKFVTWPEECVERSPRFIRLGVYGRDPFGTTLEKTFRGKQINGRAVTIRRFRDAREGRECDVVFVATRDWREIDALLDVVRGRPILTVGDVPGFAERGGMFNFFMMAQRVRFEVNLAKTMEVRLRVSSKLLQLARVIR